MSPYYGGPGGTFANKFADEIADTVTNLIAPFSDRYYIGYLILGMLGAVVVMRLVGWFQKG